MTTSNTATLLMHCADQRGIVATLTSFVGDHGGNIVDIDEHVDRAESRFFMRIQWDLAGFDIPRDQVHRTMQPLFERFGMTTSLHFSDRRTRMAVFCSKQPHCLYDILARIHSEEWNVELPLVISNHDTLAHVAHQFGVNYHTIPVNSDGKAVSEARQLALLEEHDIDLVVLARYMQIVTGTFVSKYENRIINIHHSFLPAFAGAKPYHGAHERGVKIIGATSHYVTEQLDAGPIIEQDIAHVSHKHSIRDLIRKGKDLEKIVLARAIWLHLQHRILVYQNKTIVFD